MQCRGVREQHDLTYNASEPCMWKTQKVGSLSDCTSDTRINFCSWCGPMKTCLYKDDNHLNQCPVWPSDLEDCYSKSNQTACEESAPTCAWSNEGGCYQPKPMLSVTGQDP